MDQYRNCYISKMAVIVANIVFCLLVYGIVYPSQYDVSFQSFKRYISNIRMMFSEYQLYNYNIVYDSINKRYLLVIDKNNI